MDRSLFYAYNLPFVLIFAGVISGIMTFGVIGLFIGPVALALTQACPKVMNNVV